MIWDTGFVAGLAYGAGALVVAWTIGFLFRRLASGPAPVGGVLLTLAVLLALPAATSVPPGLLWGLGLLIVGGLAAQTWPLLSPFGAALAAPGAWLLGAESVLPGEGWVRWFVFVAIVVCASLVSRFATHPLTGSLTPVMFAMFSIGVFLSVPDTEEALVLLGASLPVAVLSVPHSPSRFGVAGASATVGAALWVIAQGGVGRPAAIIGATACLSLLVADPMARLFTPGDGSMLDHFPAGWGRLVVASLVQFGLALGVARTAGSAGRVTSAALIAVTFLVLEVGLLALGNAQFLSSAINQSTPPPTL